MKEFSSLLQADAEEDVEEEEGCWNILSACSSRKIWGDLGGIEKGS